MERQRLRESPYHQPSLRRSHWAPRSQLQRWSSNIESRKRRKKTLRKELSSVWGGVKLHYIEVGQGEPLVLFHGNGSMRSNPGRFESGHALRFSDERV